MTQSDSLEGVARRRLRSLRQARGWSLEELGRRAGIGPSTLSRLETGQRRMALDHLVLLARVLDTTVDELLIEGDDEDVVIRARRDSAGGSTFWLLTPPDDTSGRVVVKMRLPARERLPETRVHPGAIGSTCSRARCDCNSRAARSSSPPGARSASTR